AIMQSVVWGTNLRLVFLDSVTPSRKAWWPSEPCSTCLVDRAFEMSARQRIWWAINGPLTLADELFSSGRIAFNGAGSDSGVYLGWFKSMSKTNKTTSEHQEPQTNIPAGVLERTNSGGDHFSRASTSSPGRRAGQVN